MRMQGRLREDQEEEQEEEEEGSSGGSRDEDKVNKQSWLLRREGLMTH
jgi:hypothetical protein